MKTALNGVEFERRFRESGQTLMIFLFLHARPNSSFEEISKTLEISRQATRDSLTDLYWGGWILQDENNQFFPVPVFPFAPLVMLQRMMSKR